MGINSISVTGDYSQSTTCGSSLAANSSCKVFVTFTPTACGTRYGVLTIVDSDGASPQLINLTGIGTQVSVVPNSLTFASQSVGTSSAPQSVTLTNLGNSSLAISGISLTGTPQSLAQIILNHPATYPGVPTFNYGQSTNCGPSLAAGASCSITITFSPTLTGTINAGIAISDNEADSPQLISIMGSGQ